MLRVPYSWLTAVLGTLVLACGRERSRENAGSGDTLPPVGAVDTSRAPADTTTRAAALPETTAAPRPAPNATEPPRPEPSKPDSPGLKPNIYPRPAPSPESKPVRLPRQPPPQDTAARSAQPDTQVRDPYHQAPKDTVSQAVYNGWKQFNLNCARCHGEDVLGTTIAPHLIMSLKPDGPINTKELFIQVVCHGRPEKGMPAWCPLGLDQEKIEQIYAYVKARSEGKIGPGRPAVRS